MSNTPNAQALIDGGPFKARLLPNGTKLSVEAQELCWLMDNEHRAVSEAAYFIKQKAGPRLDDLQCWLMGQAQIRATIRDLDEVLDPYEKCWLYQVPEAPAPNPEARRVAVASALSAPYGGEATPITTAPLRIPAELKETILWADVDVVAKKKRAPRTAEQKAKRNERERAKRAGK